MIENSLDLINTFIKNQKKIDYLLQVYVYMTLNNYRVFESTSKN